LPGKDDYLSAGDKNFIIIKIDEFVKSQKINSLSFRRKPESSEKINSLSFRRKPESSDFSTFWMPDQVRHDEI
jgi:hypothetical protein